MPPGGEGSLNSEVEVTSLLLGMICPRVQSYVVLPQAWASPYQCLHMFNGTASFGQDVTSVAPFSGRLASLPLRQALTTNRKDLKPSFTEGRNPFRFPWRKEQRLGYLQQRCTQWSRWAPRFANLRRGGRKAATSCIAFFCHAHAVTVRSAESLSSAIPLGTSTERANSKRANHGRSRLFQDAVSSVSFWLRSFSVCG